MGRTKIRLEKKRRAGRRGSRLQSAPGKWSEEAREGGGEYERLGGGGSAGANQVAARTGRRLVLRVVAELLRGRRVAEEEGQCRENILARGRNYTANTELRRGVAQGGGRRGWRRRCSQVAGWAGIGASVMVTRSEWWVALGRGRKPLERFSGGSTVRAQLSLTRRKFGVYQLASGGLLGAAAGARIRRGVAQPS